MFPIIYESTEVNFDNNGLGRLRDCISCIVTEERNGIYECDFEYPVDGANYDLIQVGRIIGVTHDDTGDVQPFDIVSYTRPINGVVTYHAVHISYRQLYMTITYNGIQSLFGAFKILKENAYPTNPFIYNFDGGGSQYVPCFNGIPITVRQALGGVEGSILDTFGGEYEFDKFNVNLWKNRGKFQNFTIRYGVNLLDYNEEYDSSGCFDQVVPYWTDGTNRVVGSVQNYNGNTPSGRVQCIPLDLSEKFETKPTKTAVEEMGASIMNSKNPIIPAQNITVSFARLQDLGIYSEFENLFSCRLCDTVRVVFPDYNSTGDFKIVRTVWNVLMARYDEMELGDLSTSLSEALGIKQETTGKYLTADSNGDVFIPGQLYLAEHTGFVGGWNGASVTRSPNLPSGTTYQDMDVSITLSMGIFVIIAKVQFGSNSTGRRAMRLTIDGTEIGHTAVNNGAVSGAVTNLQTAGIIAVTDASSTIKVQAFQNSGSSLACTTTYRYVRIK